MKTILIILLLVLNCASYENGTRLEKWSQASIFNLQVCIIFVLSMIVIIAEIWIR